MIFGDETGPKQYGAPTGSVAATIKSKMEGGNIFGDAEKTRKDNIRNLYQEQLKQQLHEKMAEKEAEKQRKLIEDQQEEERIRKDLEELKQQYAKEMKEDGKDKPPEPFDFGNVDNGPRDNKSVYSRPPHRDSRKSVRIKIQDKIEEPRTAHKIQDYNHPLTHDYQNNKLHSDYGHSLDSDIARLRMEVNLQHKSLIDQISASKFKAKQAAQERDLARNDLDRLIESMRNKTNRYYKHEKPLNNLKDEMMHAKLRSTRDYRGSSHSRRNLDTYSKLYFNDFNTPAGREFIHNDKDPFNINVPAPSQSRMGAGLPRTGHAGNYGTVLNTNSQTVSFGGAEKPVQNFIRPTMDPLSYGRTQFEKDASNAMNQIDGMINPADGYETHEAMNKSLNNMQPLSMEDDLQAVTQSIPIEDPHDKIHNDDLQQLDNVLESLGNA